MTRHTKPWQRASGSARWEPATKVLHKAKIATRLVWLECWMHSHKEMNDFFQYPSSIISCLRIPAAAASMQPHHWKKSLQICRCVMLCTKKSFPLAALHFWVWELILEAEAICRVASPTKLDTTRNSLAMRCSSSEYCSFCGLECCRYLQKQNTEASWGKCTETPLRDWGAPSLVKLEASARSSACPLISTIKRSIARIAGMSDTPKVWRLRKQWHG